MPYKIECPFCAAWIEVPDELDNTTAACPSCNQEIYLTREEAVEDSDPAVDSMRRESAAAEQRHQNELRQVMMAQEQARQSRENSRYVLNILLWVFLWGPLLVGVLIYLIGSIVSFLTFSR
jgi:hypothetical protein